ncbi:MAG: F0F1 ATP synthase subunit A [Patescibacteria group bacterium]|nr:F0F1 ATP synthase subunit A [Patescibacteria group bacterium]MDE2590555.1 F0F1 ATP synthase subunit A [Patescibacteria group bacterium]
MVALASETIFNLGPLPVTNSLIETVIVDALIVVGLIYLNKHLKKIPGLFQNMLEVAVDGLYGLTQSVSEKNAAVIFPWFMGFFIFILISNWLGLLPGFGTVGFTRGGEFVPLLRSSASDINTTLAFALISTIVTQFFAFKTVGVKEHLSRYFSLNPILLFVGLLEVLSIFTNIISLSFRLFGNIFAGDVVLTTISGMFAFLLPLPFMALEMIVGLVQALVFAMLTMAFMAILMTPHHEGGEHA